MARGQKALETPVLDRYMLGRGSCLDHCNSFLTRINYPNFRSSSLEFGTPASVITITSTYENIIYSLKSLFQLPVLQRLSNICLWYKMFIEFNQLCCIKISLYSIVIQQGHLIAFLWSHIKVKLTVNQINFRLFGRKRVPQLTHTQIGFAECYSVVEKRNNDMGDL